VLGQEHLDQLHHSLKAQEIDLESFRFAQHVNTAARSKGKVSCWHLACHSHSFKRDGTAGVETMALCHFSQDTLSGIALEYQKCQKPFSHYNIFPSHTTYLRMGLAI
jgi:hypothetical protein